MIKIIKLLKQIASPRGTHGIGCKLVIGKGVTIEEAEAFIKDGAAEWVTDKPSPAKTKAPDEDDEQKAADEAPDEYDGGEAEMVHVGRGKYNVVDSEGNIVKGGEKVSKEVAEKLVNDLNGE